MYIPLGGSRVGKVRHWLNLMLVFLISGLWHGANWTFVIWGGLHGAAQVAESIVLPKGARRTDAQKHGLVWWIRVAAVFAFCCFAWIFFRVGNLGDAKYVLKHLFLGIGSPLEYLVSGWQAFGMETWNLVYLAVVTALLAAFDYRSLGHDVLGAFVKKPLLVRWTVYLVLALALVLFSRKGGTTEFIYFQF